MCGLHSHSRTIYQETKIKVVLRNMLFNTNMPQAKKISLVVTNRNFVFQTLKIFLLAHLQIKEIY